jgi:hypothetical protein
VPHQELIDSLYTICLRKCGETGHFHEFDEPRRCIRCDVQLCKVCAKFSFVCNDPICLSLVVGNNELPPRNDTLSPSSRSSETKTALQLTFDRAVNAVSSNIATFSPKILPSSHKGLLERILWRQDEFWQRVVLVRTTDGTEILPWTLNRIAAAQNF